LLLAPLLWLTLLAVGLCHGGSGWLLDVGRFWLGGAV
jgi:hypothetical protein